MDVGEARHVLGVVSDASPSEIRAVFRRLMREHHPDSVGTESTERAVRIIEAYKLLEQMATNDDRDRSDVSSDEGVSEAREYAARLSSARATRAQQREARHAAARAAAAERAEEWRAREDQDRTRSVRRFIGSAGRGQDGVADLLLAFGIVKIAILGPVLLFGAIGGLLQLCGELPK